MSRPRSIFEMMNEPEMTSTYKKGDCVNVNNLLFNYYRDYLVKYNSDQVVKAEQLKGKVIVLHFVLLDSNEDWRWTNTAHLEEVYTQLLSHSPPRPFEVVFVPLSGTDDHVDYLQDRFFDVFSTMPWPAIPWWDAWACLCLAQSFVASANSGFLPSSVVISPTGVILQLNALPLIRAYGAGAYPFSDSRIAFFQMEDYEARNFPSLEALLISTDRNYVINNIGDKVNVCDLADKVVALYLYEDGCTDNDLTAMLEKAYRRCARVGIDFEVVLIYIHDSPNTFGRTNIDPFTKKFETMPWLALPFKDVSCKKVLRVFKYPIELGGEEPDPSLVIIGPHGNFVERLGASVLMNFGVEAFPFTRKKACTMQIEKVKKLKLKMLFGREAVFLQYCNPTFQKFFFSEIDVRKPVIVFPVFTTLPNNHEYLEFKMKLVEKYLERKCSSDEFEVIQIGGWEEEVVPWFKMPFSRSWFDRAYKNVNKIFSDILLHKGYGVFVFDRAGKVARATINPESLDFEASDFPFSGGRLEAEVVYDLYQTLNWIFS